ncbi:MAG: hypothetical protein CL758_01860 [Chloroflexi bacterium]|nr:hypothetical protein [Chloroflexota bacterium]
MNPHVITAKSTLDKKSKINNTLLERHQRNGNYFWRIISLLSVFLILGIIGFVMKLNSGFSDKVIWGYYAAMFAFILTTAQAAPMVAIAPRLAKAHWRRPISRTAEIWSIVGLFNLILFIPILWVLPSLEDRRRSLWFWDAAPGFESVPVFSPHIWTTLALCSLVFIGIMLLWLSALPDLALIRDKGTGWQQKVAKKLSKNWIGTSKQWHWLYHRLGILGALYFAMMVFVHFLISIDFLLVLVPGWIDALLPITHAANALQAGVATMMLTMFCLRKFGGYKDYIGYDQVWGLGKLLFALSLLWFWFWFSSFNVFWYGKKPNELSVIDLLTTGPYLIIFIGVFILNFVFPLFMMIWNPVRRSFWGPPLIAVGVIIGTFLDRIRLYVAAYSVPGIGDPNVSKHALPTNSLPAHLPEISDIFIMLGYISGSILVFMLATKIIPVINIWEQREVTMYEVHKKFHRTEVKILGKPD